MSLVTWGASPWGQPVILHAAWYLLWVSLAAGGAFVVAHTLWTGLRSSRGAGATIAPEVASKFPAQVARHSLAARLFHWIMAACMLTLLGSAFLPKLGVHFDWVGLHVLAGAILVAAIIFHIAHVICCLDFWAIWPSPADWPELRKLLGGKRVSDNQAMPGKYPLGNKLFHLAILALALTMAVTGLCLLPRVGAPLVTRDPYALFSDGGWGVVYAMHGLAGLSLVALVMIHIYFALRPDKLPITRAMIVGSMDRDFFLRHHDPARWYAGGNPPNNT